MGIDQGAALIGLKSEDGGWPGVSVSARGIRFFPMGKTLKQNITVL